MDTTAEIEEALAAAKPKPLSDADLDCLKRARAPLLERLDMPVNDLILRLMATIEARQVPDDVLFPDRTHGASTVRAWREHAEKVEQANKEWQDRAKCLEEMLRQLRPADGEHGRVDNGECMVSCGDESLRWRGEGCQCGYDDTRASIDALLKHGKRT